MKKLSIIVPIYNVESYLERCLLSLSNQDIAPKDYEIICINDGSTDNSRKIILYVQTIMNNIILIDQENKGVSAARNAGLQVAKGEYILFVDADDFVERYSLGTFLEIAAKQDLDLLYMGFEEWDINGKYLGKNNYEHLHGEVLDGVETYYKTRGKGFLTPDRSHAILLRNSSIKTFALEFTPLVPYLEDGLFIGKYLCLAKRCGFYDKPFYKYLKRPESASTSIISNEQSNKKLTGFIIAANDIKTFLNTKSLTTRQIDIVNILIAKFVLISVMTAISTRRISSIIWVKKKLKDGSFLHLDLSGVQDLNLYARIFNVSFWLFCLYFIIETRILNVKSCSS